MQALQRHLAHTPADAVFILGDLFEAWVGDDARHAGFEADCAALLCAGARRRHLAFMPGNRDFLVGADLLEACDVQALPDPTLLRAFGDCILLTHGDALCTDDVAYQRYRTRVRSPAWQAEFLARPLPQRREAVAQMRSESRDHQARQGPAAWIDLDPASTAGWMRAAGAATLVHGHTHRPGRHQVAPGLTRHVLADWDFDAAGPPRGDVLRWTAQGLARVAPATAT